jgi:hypothetical protein
MTDRYALIALQDQIEAWWLAAAEAKRFGGLDCPVLSTNLTERDATSFMRGVDAGWIGVEHPNKFRSAFFGEHGPTGYTFFGGGKGAPANLLDELFAHYAAATELVLDYGWRVDQVVSEARDPCGELTVGALDLLVFVGAASESPALGVEAKGERTKVSRLIHGIDSCRGNPGPGHPMDEHRKCLALRHFRLDHLWVVACGVRDLYRVEHSEATLRLTLEDDDAALSAPT